MQAAATSKRFAWQPLTPSGVAAFADASVGRLLLVQSLIACLVAGSLVWFLQGSWFPVIRQAVAGLPEQGEIRSGQLDWHGEPVVTLAENRFLALTVDLNHEGTARSPAHIQVELGRTYWRVSTLLGFTAEPYPPDRRFPFSRTALVPWWGAWAPYILVVVAIGTVFGLLLIWTILACLYFLPVWLVGLYADRQLSLAGSWRLAGGALMPGAVLMLAAILAYGWGMLNLLEEIGFFLGHFVLGWAYLVLSTLSLTRSPAVPPPTVNPFTPGPQNEPPRKDVDPSP
jgi:hypothetical protein